MPVTPILSGRFGVLLWASQTARDTVPTTGWKTFGIVRDARVRVPAGTEVVRAVGMSLLDLERAGIVVVERALEAVDITVTYEAVGIPFAEVAQMAHFQPSGAFQGELPYISVLFGDPYRGLFVAVDGKVNRVELDCPADRIVTGTIGINARYVTNYTGTVPSFEISPQVFIGKEGKINWGEVLEFRFRLNHRLDARHTIKPTVSTRPPDYLVETVTEISGSVRAFWYESLDALKNAVLNPIDIQFTLQDFADSNKTITITLPSAKVRDVSKTIPAEREIEVELEYLGMEWDISYTT